MLKEYLNKLRSYTPERVSDDLFVILKSEEQTAVNMLTDQLFQGKDSKGNDLPKYSFTSVNVYSKPSGPWRLYDTGVFYRSLFFEGNDFPVLFGSSDLKSGLIYEKLDAKGSNPETVFKLSEENRKDLSRSYLLEKTKDYFRSILSVH